MCVPPRVQSLVQDTLRVRLLFSRAQAEGVAVCQRRLSSEHFYNVLRGDENLVRCAALLRHIVPDRVCA